MCKITNQHGDVLLEAVEALPNGVKPIEVKEGFIVERGEGVHVHVLEGVDGVEVFEKGGETFFRVSKEVRLNHEEHGPQSVYPGIYKKRLEQCYDYETEETRNTYD